MATAKELIIIDGLNNSREAGELLEVEIINMNLERWDTPQEMYAIGKGNTIVITNFRTVKNNLQQNRITQLFGNPPRHSTPMGINNNRIIY